MGATNHDAIENIPSYRFHSPSVCASLFTKSRDKNRRSSLYLYGIIFPSALWKIAFIYLCQNWAATSSLRRWVETKCFWRSISSSNCAKPTRWHVTVLYITPLRDLTHGLAGLTSNRWYVSCLFQQRASWVDNIWKWAGSKQVTKTRVYIACCVYINKKIVWFTDLRNCHTAMSMPSIWYKQNQVCGSRSHEKEHQQIAVGKALVIQDIAGEESAIWVRGDLLIIWELRSWLTTVTVQQADQPSRWRRSGQPLPCIPPLAYIYPHRVLWFP